MKDKEKQYISMNEVLTKRSFEPIANCNCKIESRIDYAVRNENKEGAFADLLNQEQAELQKAMIEKIKLIIDERCEAELGQVHASSMGGKVIKTVSTKLIAKDICEYLTKDSVVLSREEYESIINENTKLKDYNDKLSQGIYWGNGEQFCNRLKEERKETAEKIFDTLYQWLDLEEIEKYGFVTIQKFDFLRKFREIYKQFGVEIKE